MKTAWVNFRELREKLDVREVLRHYRISVNARNGVQHQGTCPLKTHQGNRRASSFSVNLDKGIWRCFGCGAQGNIIDLATLLEGFDPKLPEDVRRTALILAERYQIESQKPAAQPKPQKAKAAMPAGKALMNAPLDFTLKGLDPNHDYLKGQGLMREALDHFELGYASRGMMQGRIAIPLRNAEGQLIGYAGKACNDTVISESNPEYLFPTEREHEGKRYDFNKGLFLYHGHAVPAPADDLIIVSNFPAVWWLWQNGFPHTVALMGSSCTPQQSALIVGLVPRTGRVWVFTDGTKAGRYCAEEVLRLVTPYRFCRWIELRDNRLAINHTTLELRELLAR